uniref:Transcription initiation factor IIE subunit alpha N-terminal domain-containing protein n=1 Tax=Oryza nivara TaxID=4536 RepID=A0A0E0FN09_ORYNI
MASMEPLNLMVRMVARAFYDDVSLARDPKSARGDNCGLAVVVLEALGSFFEEEKLVRRCHRKQSPKGVNIYNDVSATAGDVHPFTKGGEKAKMHTHSYCCLDYAQVYDVVRYRIHRMRKKLKDGLDDRDTVQHYVCPNCKRSDMDDYFHCEHCKGELRPESEKLTLDEIVCGGGNAIKHTHDKLKDMQQRMEEQLKPLIAVLDRVKDLPFPSFMSLQDWERATIEASANGAVGSSQNSEGRYSSKPMPFLGETEVEVNFLGSTGAQEGVESGMESIKPQPSWMNRKRTVLAGEHKEENNNTANLDQSSEAKSDKKQLSEEDEMKSIQEAYAKAYYEAIQKRQEDEGKRAIQEESLACISDQPFASDAQFERRLGAKSKRDDGGESGDDGIELKVRQPTGNIEEVYKFADLNVETQELVEKNCIPPAE